MTQKLLIMERDTKEELQEAIKKHLDKDTKYKVIGFSVLEQKREEDQGWVYYYEAWMIIDIPDENPNRYNHNGLLVGFE